MAFDAGSIEGTLDLDRDPFQAGLQAAIRDIEAFEKRKFTVTLNADTRKAREDLALVQGIAQHIDENAVTIQVNAETSAAMARLEELRAEIAALGDGVDDTTARINGGNSGGGNGGSSGGGGGGGLIGALLALAPAIAPLGAVPAGALGAVVGGAGSAVIALTGVKKEISAGTTLGGLYSTQIEKLKGNLSLLQQTGAEQSFAGIFSNVRDLQSAFPVVNREVSDFTAYLGDIESHAFRGTLGGLTAFRPLFLDLINDAQNLTRALDTATNGGLTGTSGSGLAKFVEYTRSVLPEVEHVLGQVTEAVSHLLQGGASAGLGIVTAIGALADVINAIPVPVLQTVVPLLVQLALIKSATGLLGISTGLSSIGPAGIVAAAGLYVFIQAQQENARQAANNAKQINTFADALRADNGEIGSNTQSVIASAFAHNKFHDSLLKQGVTLTDYTNYLDGNTSALDKNKLRALDVANLATGNQQQVSAAFKQARIDEANYVFIKGESERAVAKANPGLAEQARLLGTTTTALIAARAAQQDQAQATNDATLKMQEEGDAAGLLKQALDALNGKAITLAEAQNNLDKGLLGVTKKTSGADAALTGLTDSAVRNRSELIGLVQNVEDVATATGGMANQTEAGRQSLIAMKQQIIDNAVAHGEDRAAVTAFVDSLLKIPASVPPVDIQVNAAAALEAINGVKTALANLDVNKTVTVTAYINSVLGSTTAPGYNSITRDSHGANGAAFAKGGTGPGGVWPGYAPGVDSITAKVSPGEGVLVPEAVRGIGGARGVYDLNRRFAPRVEGHTASYGFSNGGTVQRFATGGTAAPKGPTQSQIDNVRGTLQTKLAEYAGDAQSALYNASAFETAIQKIQETQALPAVKSDLIAVIGQENIQLGDYIRVRMQIVDRLKAAQTALTDITNKSNAETTSVIGAVKGGFNVTGAGNGSLAGFYADLNQQIAGAAKFASNLQALKDKGLDNELLQQLGEAGYKTAGVNASLLAGQSTDAIAALNAQYTQLENLAINSGVTVSSALYDAGVNAAQGLVNGLQSQSDALLAASGNMADLIVSQVKSNLGIASPSKVFRDEVGVQIGHGLIAGMDASHGALGDASKRLTNKAKQAAGGGVASMSGSLGGPGASPAAQIVAELQALRAELADHPEATAEMVASGVGDRLDRATSTAARLSQTLTRQNGRT